MIRGRRAVSSLLLGLTIFFLLSCSEWSEYRATRNFTTVFNNTDTLKERNLSVFARISQHYPLDTLHLILIVKTPSGKSYSDTLLFPTNGESHHIRVIKSGRWRDTEWNYRRNIVMKERGDWQFIIKRYTAVNRTRGIGAMGIIVK